MYEFTRFHGDPVAPPQQVPVPFCRHRRSAVSCGAESDGRRKSEDQLGEKRFGDMEGSCFITAAGERHGLHLPTADYMHVGLLSSRCQRAEPDIMQVSEGI